MFPMGQEAQNFGRACEAIHALLPQGMLIPEDQDFIEFSARDLLSKLEQP